VTSDTARRARDAYVVLQEKGFPIDTIQERSRDSAVIIVLDKRCGAAELESAIQMMKDEVTGTNMCVHSGVKWKQLVQMAPTEKLEVKNWAWQNIIDDKERKGDKKDKKHKKNNVEKKGKHDANEQPEVGEERDDAQEDNDFKLVRNGPASSQHAKRALKSKVRHTTRCQYREFCPKGLHHATQAPLCDFSHTPAEVHLWQEHLTMPFTYLKGYYINSWCRKHASIVQAPECPFLHADQPFFCYNCGKFAEEVYEDGTCEHCWDKQEYQRGVVRPSEKLREYLQARVNNKQAHDELFHMPG